jgi:hypothetical protein
MAQKKEVFGVSTDEDLTLEHLGYQQGRTAVVIILITVYSFVYRISALV